jgi:hypothetical protein
VLRPDGTPATGVHVQASGRPLREGKAGEGGNENTWHGEVTDAEGRFAFTGVPAGVYELSVGVGGSDAMRGELRDLRAEGGRPLDGLRLQLRAAIKVTGRVDMSAFAAKPEWIWVSVHRPDDKEPDKRAAADQVTGFGVEDDGTFETDELDAGRFFARVHFHVDNTWQQHDVPDAFVVTPAGLSGVVLRPVPANKN